MTARHILFISVQGHGHVLPSLGVVQALAEQGHRVTYVTTPMFGDEVRAAGATVVHYKSEFDTFHVPDAVGRDDAEALIHGVYVAENVAILRAAESALAGDPPDLVVYDVFPFIAGRLLATRWDIPAVRLSPIFAANEHYSIFEALWTSNGFGHPADVPAVRATMTGLLGEYGIDLGIREFWDAVEELTIVFIPKSFQIAPETFDERFVFVGPAPSLTEAAPWQPARPGDPVLLVSLGNQFNNHPEFFRACADAFAGSPWQVVMAVGTFLDPATVGPLPANVEMHQWIPFRSVLRHAAACITQGTTGAVMEALTHGVPMVVVPQYATEARPSAERVPELGLGALLTPEQVNARDIRAAVEDVVADDAVRQRVRRVQQEIREAGGPLRAAEEIGKYLARTEHSPHAG
jgi:MGT family glycosyltransferase